MEEEKEVYKGLTIECKTKGLDEIANQIRTANEAAKELEATLERVVSLIERISSSSDGKKSSVREISERLYELEKESLKANY